MSFIFTLMSFGFLFASFIPGVDKTSTAMLSGIFFLASLIQDVKDKLK
jgi:hypothetical protein